MAAKRMVTEKVRKDLKNQVKSKVRDAVVHARTKRNMKLKEEGRRSSSDSDLGRGKPRRDPSKKLARDSFNKVLKQSRAQLGSKAGRKAKAQEAFERTPPENQKKANDKLDAKSKAAKEAVKNREPHKGKVYQRKPAETLKRIKEAMGGLDRGKHATATRRKELRSKPNRKMTGGNKVRRSTPETRRVSKLFDKQLKEGKPTPNKADVKGKDNYNKPTKKVIENKGRRSTDVTTKNSSSTGSENVKNKIEIKNNERRNQRIKEMESVSKKKKSRVVKNAKKLKGRSVPTGKVPRLRIPKVRGKVSSGAGVVLSAGLTAIDIVSNIANKRLESKQKRLMKDAESKQRVKSRIALDKIKQKRN